MQEGVLHQMAQLVEILVVFSGLLAVLARRNHRLGSLGLDLRHNRVAVIAFVAQQVFHLKSVDQPFSLRAICAGTLCNKGSERHTIRIHGQMYLGVEPPFVRLMP
jgi:hypothetical protein